MSAAVRRGYLLVAIATIAAGFAMSANQNIVANYFEHELGLGGAQFGYITAIREIPGFLLIFVTALFYRVPLPYVTAGALGVLALGYGLFGYSWDFWSVAPWVVLSSLGYHTWLQVQPALAMSLTTEGRAGRMLGRMASFNAAGALASMVVVAAGFHFGWLEFRSTFVLCGLLAFVAALAIVRFPHLHDGQVQERAAKRAPMVLRGEYRYYYLLSLLDGGRQQIFFSFGLWVLVDHFGLDVPTISAVLFAVTLLSMTTGPYVGKLVDRYGEKQVLAAANVGYVAALAGYALADDLRVAVLCYVIYSFIFPLSPMGAAVYLRKVAVADEIAPSLAMGLTMQHFAAIVVPLAAGYVLNYVGYQVPFLVACVFACLNFYVTRRLSPETQKSPRRLAEERARLATVRA